MGLTDVAGVLSRKFVVGFFIPAFFGALALKLLVADAAVPRGLREAGAGTQILILGGVALLIGLLLWGVHYSLIRVLEGYWLIAPTLPNRTGPRDVSKPTKSGRSIRLAFGQWKRSRWQAAREHLIEMRDQPIGLDASQEQKSRRTNAAEQLTSRFPPESRMVLPTELGNVIRAFEQHPRERYGLDGINTWPNIVTMLTESERADLDEKTTDVAFWVNSLTVVVLGGALLFVERLWHPPGELMQTATIELAIAGSVAGLGVWMYRQLIGAAARWGEPVRAAFDMHRLELYDRLGIRRPYTQHEYVEAGRAINRLLAFGEPLPLKWRAAPTTSDASRR